MRLLHVYRTYFPETQGGLEEVIRQICSNTADGVDEVRVLTLARKPEPSVINRPEANVFRATNQLEIASCSLSLDVVPLYRELYDWADLVHYHFPWPFADVLDVFCAPRNRKPSIVTYHSDIVRQQLLRMVYAPLMRRFLHSMDRIVCTSPNYFATSTVLSRFSGKVSVIPIGLEESTYPEVDTELPPLLEGLKEFFLFVGVLRYYKGLHILLEAMADAPYDVVIAGSGPIERELMKQARDLKLRNVHFTGYVSDQQKVALFRRCLGIVFPSYLRSEAFGVTLLEGAMYGKPLISTEVGSGTSHVNVHHETGLVVTPGSATSLRHAMDQLYSRPEMAALMGRRARKRYEDFFTGRRMGSRYLALYEELIGPRSRVTAPKDRGITLLDDQLP